MSHLFWSSDRQWELIKPHLPFRAADVLRNFIERIPCHIHTVPTVRRCHDENDDQLREHLKNFMPACNVAKRLTLLVSFRARGPGLITNLPVPPFIARPA